MGRRGPPTQRATQDDAFRPAFRRDERTTPVTDDATPRNDDQQRTTRIEAPEVRDQFGSPAMLMFDFAAAFPSVDRKFIHDTLRAMQVPSGPLNLVASLYQPATSYDVRPDGPSSPRFEVHTGVPQGCPLPGSIFAAITTGLIAELSSIVGSSNVSLFADDAAIVVHSLSLLPEVAQVFRRFHDASSLARKPAKCVLVPLADLGGWDETRRLYHDTLVDMVPEWREFAIESSSVHLGARLGPSTDSSGRWAAALDKFSKRVLGMARSSIAPSAGLKYMTKFATPVVAYTAMMTAVHKDIERVEDLAPQRLLRMPHKAPPKNFAAHLEAIGLPRVKPMVNSCAAMLRRSAVRHASDIHSLQAQLAAMRSEHGCLRSLTDDTAMPDRIVWKAPALIDDMT